MPNPSSVYPRNANDQELTLLLSGDDMDDVDPAKSGNAGTGSHFSMPGAIPESNHGSNGAPVHPPGEGRIDGKEGNATDDGQLSDASDGSDRSDHMQPYYVARYKGIDLASGPSGASGTPKGAYRRSESFRSKKATTSSLAPPHKLSGNPRAHVETPPRKISGNLGGPPTVSSTTASAVPVYPDAKPRIGNLTRESTLTPPFAPAGGAPGRNVSIEMQTEGTEHNNFLKSLWSQLANSARQKRPPEQRFIGFLTKNRNRGLNVPARRLVSYNRSPTRGHRSPFQADLHTSDSSESPESEPVSPWTASSVATKATSRRSVTMRPNRASLGSQGRQRTFTPSRTPAQAPSAKPEATSGSHLDLQPLLMTDIAGADKEWDKSSKLSIIFSDEPVPTANGVAFSVQEKPAAPLGKEGSATNVAANVTSAPAPANVTSTATKASRYAKNTKAKVSTKKVEDPSDWDDGLIYGFRLNGNGGCTNISLSNWNVNPGTPEEPVWIHLNGMCAGAHKWLWEESGLERLVVEALTADDARPRSSSFNFGTLFVIRAVNTGGTPEDMVSMRLFLQPELLVTVRRRELAAEEDVKEPLERGRGPRTAAGVAVLLLEKCTLRMGPVVGEMEDVLDSIEHAWVEKGNSEALSNDLGNLRRRVVQMRRYIQPQRDALVDLLVEDSEAPEWHEWHRQRLREVTNSTTRMMEDLAVVWERSNVLHEEMKSLAAERQGKRLYVMTMMTCVFLPLTFVTGLLGINVGGIPFRGAPTENNEGFWVTVCVCGSLVVLELLIMRGLGWMHSG